MVRATQNRIKAVSLVDQVTSELREDILNGALPAGQSVTITKLAEDLGTSHIPIREALRRLESEGLVETRPGHGATVTPLRKEDVVGIYRIRRLIEPELAGLSCRSLTETDFTRLEEHINALDQVPAVQEVPVHKEFHFLLLRPAASQWDIRILEYLWNANERYSRLFFDQTSPAHLDSVRIAHEILLDAARSRKPARIKSALVEHLMENEAALQRELGSSNGGLATR